MATPSANNVMLGRGALYFDRRDATNNVNGSIHLGNCDEFTLSFDTETLELKDYTQQSSSVYKEVLIETNVGGTIAGYEFSKENWALATMGSTAAYTQAAASIVGEVLAESTVTVLDDKFFFTAKRNISNVVVKQGATTHTVNVDYQIMDATRGIIKVLSTGAIAPGTDLTVDYDHAAIVSGDGVELVYGGTVAAIEGKLRFVSNNTTGPNWDLVMFNASIRPNGDIGFISDEFNKWTLEVTAQSDAAGAYGGSASSPYYTLTKLAA